MSPRGRWSGAGPGGRGLELLSATVGFQAQPGVLLIFQLPCDSIQSHRDHSPPIHRFTAMANRGAIGAINEAKAPPTGLPRLLSVSWI